jgi:hypothetical protein
VGALLVVVRALALGIALTLSATAAWAQDPRLPGPAAFAVSLKREADPAAARIEGRVDNASAYHLTDVRLEVEGLDANRRSVGRIFVWAIGDLVPGGQSSFVFEAMPGAVSYGIGVVSYDVVSGPTSEPR